MNSKLIPYIASIFTSALTSLARPMRMVGPLAAVATALASTTQAAPPTALYANGVRLTIDDTYGVARTGKLTWATAAILSMCELIERAPGTVVDSRSQAATPELSYSGLKGSTWYTFRVRTYGENTWLTRDFYTGPMPAPAVTDFSVSNPLEVGQTLTANVSATGPSLSFRWTLNGNPVGGNSPSLSLAPGSFANEDRLAVAVVNASGTAPGGPAIITILAPPITNLSISPASLTVREGDTVTFDAHYSGTPQYVQWRVPGTITVAALLREPDRYQFVAEMVNTGTVQVSVSNSRNAVSATAKLVVLPRVPVIVSPLSPITLRHDQNGELCVQASGSGLRYEWNLNGTLREDDACLSLTAGSVTDGTQVSVRVWNAGGSVTSGPISVTVLPPLPAPPRILTHPKDVVEVRGRPFSAFITTVGEHTTCQWLLNGEEIQGGIESSVSLNGLPPGIYDLQCRVTNPGGEVLSEMSFVEIVSRLPRPTATDPVLSVRPVRTGVLVRWYDTTGTVAQPLWGLERSASLLPNGWSAADPALLRSNAALRRMHFGAGNREFFRLRGR